MIRHQNAAQPIQTRAMFGALDFAELLCELLFEAWREHLERGTAEEGVRAQSRRAR